MSRKELVMKAETALERKLTPDERRFLRVATRLFKPRPSLKTIPKKTETKAAQRGPNRAHVSSDGEKPWLNQGAREIHIVRDSGGHAAFALCNRCHHSFFLEGTAIFGQVEDMLRRKFLQHECAPRQFGSRKLTEDAIRTRAYQLFEQRGHEPGHDVEDWLQAEAEIVGNPFSRGELNATLRRATAA